MHELSLCQSLVDILLAEVKKLDKPVRVRRVHVVAGALRQIVPDAMTFAFEFLTRDTPAADAVLELIVLPISARCRDCDWQGEIEEICFQCRACRSTKLDIQTGKELYLKSFEIEEISSESKVQSSE
jgi:hydrogenase nickel incorporation protein HypA/HybF